MTKPQTHPNTHAVLDAWRRLVGGEAAASGPMAEEFPGVVARLFVLNRVTADDFSFRRAGASLEHLFGRSLIDHNFLSLFALSDRALVAAVLHTAQADCGPAILHACGETLTGRRIELEFPLAPLAGGNGAVRYLGLCQSTSPDVALGGRPVRLLRATAVFPPGPSKPAPTIRLVSSR